MRRIFLAVILMLSVLSCMEKMPAGSSAQLEVMVITQPALQTRASYAVSMPYESRVTSVQVLVFDEDGILEAYSDLGTDRSGSLNVGLGKKEVWAVVNAEDVSSVTSVEELSALTVDLSSNDFSKGFVMSGNSHCSVDASGGSICTVEVERLLSRVSLTRISNSLPSSYGDMTVMDVFLCNVAGSGSLAGNAEPSIWYNKEGRSDESPRNEDSVIGIGGHLASCAPLTYVHVGSPVRNGGSLQPALPFLLYAFPNASENEPDGYHGSFVPQRTVLAVSVMVEDAMYYYPVSIEGFMSERNTAYSVSLTIAGPGTDDPNLPVRKTDLEIIADVNRWTDGASYTEYF